MKWSVVYIYDVSWILTIRVGVGYKLISEISSGRREPY